MDAIEDTRRFLRKHRTQRHTMRTRLICPTARCKSLKVTLTRLLDEDTLKCPRCLKNYSGMEVER